MGYYEKTIATIAERREGERRGAREREREGEGNVVNAERQRERERERDRTMASGRVARGTLHDDDDDSLLHDWRMMSAAKDRMYEGGNETCSHVLALVWGVCSLRQWIQWSALSFVDV